MLIKMNLMKGLLVFISFFIFQLSYAQNTGLIKGKITASSGEPIPSATIYINISEKGFHSDEYGNFEFNVPAGNLIISVTSIGYESLTEKIKIADGQSLLINFSLN